MNGSDAKKFDPAMRAEESKAAELAWHSPKFSPFRLAGLAWFAKDKAYRRMPLHPNRPLPPAVDALANQTAGAQVRFRTDSARVSVRVTLAGLAGMNHMPATGQCGFDCYVSAPLERPDAPALPQRYFRTTKYDHKQLSYECSLFDSAGPGLRDFTLNFPLYQGVEEVSVGLDEGALILPPPPYATDRVVVAYGTSITQGGCASRPGMAWTNILSRRLNVEFINLGFSGSGRGEPEVAATLAAIPNPACFILDYEGNAGWPEKLRSTFPEFIRILRESHPETPILAVSRIAFAADWVLESSLRRRIEARDFQRDTIRTLRRRGPFGHAQGRPERRRMGGDKRLFFHDGGKLLGEDFEECTVDGVHPTDLGFLRIANGLAPVLRRILPALQN